jgi:hypothetical protein
VAQTQEDCIKKQSVRPMLTDVLVSRATGSIPQPCEKDPFPKGSSLLDPSIKFLAQTTTTEDEAPKERVAVAKLAVTETVEVQKIRT